MGEFPSPHAPAQASHPGHFCIVAGADGVGVVHRWRQVRQSLDQAWIFQCAASRAVQAQSADDAGLAFRSFPPAAALHGAAGWGGDHRTAGRLDPVAAGFGHRRADHGHRCVCAVSGRHLMVVVGRRRGAGGRWVCHCQTRADCVAVVPAPVSTRPHPDLSQPRQRPDGRGLEYPAIANRHWRRRHDRQGLGSRHPVTFELFARAHHRFCVLGIVRGFWVGRRHGGAGAVCISDRTLFVGRGGFA